MHRLTYTCPHGQVELRCAGLDPLDLMASVSEAYVIASDCPCNGTHPDLSPGWRPPTSARPNNDSPVALPAPLIAAE